LRARQCRDDPSIRLAQQPFRLVDRALPGHFLEAAAPHAPERVAQAVLRAQVLVGEAALVAEPALVDLGMVARDDALDLPLPRRDVDVAADGAQAADARDILDLPRPALEAVGRGRQRADRAELDH